MTLRHGGTITIPPMVSVFTKGIGWVDEAVSASAPASGDVAGGWAMFYPIILAAPCVIRRVWWANGAAVDGTIDVGIYADDGDHKPGTRIISSGATAQSGTNAVQFVDVTDTAIGPGLYWLAIAPSSSSATLFRSASAAAYDASHRVYESVASTLPATATPLESPGATARLYLFGFSTVASP